MNTIETIKLDRVPKGKMPVLHASQYDNGRTHGIDLTNLGEEWKLDGTETLTIKERKVDNNICSMDIENTFVGSSHIEFASFLQMCACAGSNFCELRISKGGVDIGTLNFILEVEPDPTADGIESESEIRNLETQIREITEEVIGDDYYTKTQTDNAIATATEGKADTTYVNTELAKKADKTNTYTKTQTDSLLDTKANANSVYTKIQVDTALNGKADKDTTYTKSEVDTLIDNLPEPMIFKGTLGVGGTIQSLPTASASNEGWTYKVITDGTYAGQTAKVGDVFTSNGSAWVYIPSGDEDNDTWRAIKVNGVEKLGNGISSGAVDFEDTTNVKFTFDSNGNKVKATLSGIYTSSEVNDLLDDKADKSDTYTKEQVDDIVYGILPDDTASGSVANFNTSLELPLKSLEVDVNAVQSTGTPTPASPLPISGRSEINLDKCGANFCDEVFELGDISASTGENEPATTVLRTKNYIPVKPDTQYFPYIGGQTVYTLRTRFYDKDKNFIGTTQKNGTSVNYNIAFTTPVNAYYMRFTPQASYGTTYNNNISINYPSNDNAYHAYNPNGNTEVINLGGTYYGGHFTQDNAGHRKLTINMEKDTMSSSYLSGLSSSYIGYDANVTPMNNHPCIWVRNWKYPPNAKGFTSGGIKAICNAFNISMNNSSIISTQYRVYFDVDGMGITSVADFISAIETMEQNGNNLEICYEVENPVVVDLPDGEPINTLAGVNNFFADTGDTSVVFKSSVNDYVSAHSGGNLLGMGGVYLGGAKSGGSEEETDEGEDTEKTKLDEPKEEIKTIGDTKKLGGE